MLLPYVTYCNSYYLFIFFKELIVLSLLSFSSYFLSVFVSILDDLNIFKDGMLGMFGSEGGGIIGRFTYFSGVFGFGGLAFYI